MLEKIKEMLVEPLKKENIDIVDVLYEDEEKPYVDIDTCVLATNIVNPILDEADLIEESYVLNVCSKGGE